MFAHRTLWITAVLLLGLGLTGLHLNAEDRAMPAKVMMYYGPSDNEDMFDATRWFAGGQYRSRPGFEDYPLTMLRTRPAPFTRDQIEDFPVIAAMALHEHYPDADYLKLLDSEPDLSGRVRYAHSAFAEPDQPLDYYYLYIELDNTRYVVTFDRDGQSGALRKTTYRAEAIIGEYASQAEHRKVFEEIEAQERRAGRRG
jgi:hypothetical protein